MNSRLPLYVSFLFVGAVGALASGAGIMRREANEGHKNSDKEEADIPLLDEQEYVSMMQRSNAGEELSAAQKLALHHKSMVDYRNSLGAVMSLLEEAYSEEKYDQDGFQILPELTVEAAGKEILEGREKQAKDDKEADKQDREQEASLLASGSKPKFEANGQQFANDNERGEWLKAHTSNGMKNIDKGWWADERPDEERLDPQNLKVYTWRTFQLRFPYKMKLWKEYQWSKLPLAPKKVHKVRRHPSHSSSATLLEDGSQGTLVDEQGKELIWTRDYNGFYHWGTKIPTELEISAAKHPYFWQEHQKEAALAEQEKPYQLYPNASLILMDVGQKLKSTTRMVKRDALHRLEELKHGIEEEFNLTLSKEGKGYVSIKGAEGSVMHFNGKVEKVTVKKIKERLEKKTGIPWEAQKLFFQGQPMKDEDLLNEYIFGTHSAMLTLVQEKEQVVKEALAKRHLTKIETPEERKRRESGMSKPKATPVHNVGQLSMPGPKKRQAEATLLELARRSAVDRRYEEEKAAKWRAIKEAQVAKARMPKQKKQTAEAVAKPSEERPLIKKGATAKEPQKPSLAETSTATKAAEKQSVEQAAGDKKKATKEEEDKDFSALFSDDEIDDAKDKSRPSHGHAANKAVDSINRVESRPSQSMGGKVSGEATNKLWSMGNQREDSDSPPPEQPQGEHPLHYAIYGVSSKDHKWHVLKEKTMNRQMTEKEQAEWDAPPDHGIDVMDRLAPAPETLLQIETPTPYTAAAESLAEGESPEFIQISSSSSPAEKAENKASEATASKQKVLYVLDKKSMPMMEANAERIEAARKWREAANPVEEYAGRKDLDSLTELSKKRSKKEKAYDGMQAVSSGFWAEDRPDERRVDLADHKIYTWKQYRLKHSFQHSWKVEEMWKKLPTEQRVKKLGAKAFVQRFR